MTTNTPSNIPQVSVTVERPVTSRDLYDMAARLVAIGRMMEDTEVHPLPVHASYSHTGGCLFSTMEDPATRATTFTITSNLTITLERI
ncbi:hypothetical protein JT318_gp19 [Pseudomonas phage PspYZU01]|uniref:Uncharacterized protein n=1 Tax=Pseudomonas phage PspYZU01 TaxID=1983555 RepID=A0A2U7NJC2_9CAUD|nr:hypothetical protein JT318_gp19 [Pseudomonas phage PspYZU01]ASD51904.1 hypothetical protein PspYZU01_19 [Pseudomonas phage PspYZU01]